MEITTIKSVYITTTCTVRQYYLPMLQQILVSAGLHSSIMILQLIGHGHYQAL